MLFSSPNDYTMGPPSTTASWQSPTPRALGTGSVVFNGGTLSVLSDSATVTLSNTLSATSGTTTQLNIGRITPGQPGTVQFSNVQINGALNITGSGTAQLLGATFLNSGTVSIHSTPTLSFNGAVIGPNTGTIQMGDATSAVDVIFAGGSANTYGGTTILNNGILQFAKTIGNAVPGNLQIHGGLVQLLGSQQIADSASISISGGSMDLNGQSRKSLACRSSAAHLS